MKLAMLSKEEILNLLLEGDNLWENETRHEAMLLYRSLYAKFPELREMIINHILERPPTGEDKRAKEAHEYDVFELLEYLQAGGLELTNSGIKRLEQIKESYPKWKLSPDADIVGAFHVGWHRSSFTVEGIYSKKPNEVAEMLRDYKGSWEESRWDFCRTVGMTCLQHPDWALEVFRSLKHIVGELPADTTNSVISSLQLTEGSEAAWNKKHAESFLCLLESMIRERPEAEFWTGLPSLLKNWHKVIRIEVDLWINLSQILIELFKSFDYERDKEKVPEEWFQRSAGHPYGEITELYLDHAYHLAIDQKAKGLNIELDVNTLEFFEYTIGNYSVGSRYGISILGHWLAWLEAVAPEWTEKKIIPLFYWDDSKERTLVCWSGYLWSRNLSRFLSEKFNDTYLRAVYHYNEFGKTEQEGLIVHLGGLIWFKDIKVSDLMEFVTLIDGDSRRQLLWTWEDHLEKAKKEVAEDFWKNVISPYWSWSQKRYLGLPDGNKERFSFWRLLPFSYGFFREAAKKAVDLAPAAIEDTHLFPQRLAESGLSKNYPEEFTDLLVAFIVADTHPYWHAEEWQLLWDGVKDSSAHNLSRLKDELARKKILIVKK